MGSRNFGGEIPVRAHLLRSRGKGGEIADVRRDVDKAFGRVEAEFDVFTGGGPSTTTEIIRELDHFPAPVGGVITLEAKKYLIDGEINLQTNRLVAVPGSSIVGYSFVKDALYRVGGTGPLLTVPASAGNFEVAHLRLTAPVGTTLFDVYGVFPAQSTNFFATDLDLEGDVGTVRGTVIRFSDTSFVQWAEGLEVADVLSFTMVSCNMIQKSGGTGSGIDFTGTIGVQAVLVASAITAQPTGLCVNGLPNSGNMAVGARGYITACQFDNGAQHIAGLDEDDLQWNFSANSGVANSVAAASYTMAGNVTATTTAGQAWTKVLGTTTAELERRFTGTNNRATYSGGFSPKTFRVDVVLVARASVNATLAEFGVSINGADPVLGRPIELNTNKDANLAFVLATPVNENDYIEVWCRDTVGTASITVSNLDVLVSAITEGV